MKTWSEVSSSTTFQDLPQDQKEQARQQYFDTVVAPKVPKDQLDTVRASFDSDTQVKLSPGSLQKKLRAQFDKDNSQEARSERQQAANKSTVDSMGTGSRLAAGAGKAVYDTGRGIGQLLGMVSKGDVAESRAQDQALMNTKGGKIGNALGYFVEAAPATILAPTAGLGAGAALVARSAVGGAIGGVQGYASPYASTGEHVANTLSGAVIGSAIPGAGALAGKTLRGLATPEARKLAEEGVKMTPGQMLGGHAKRLEDMLTSVPIVGGAIRKGMQRSLDTFDRAAINRVIAPLGGALPQGLKGRAALDVAHTAVSDAYEKTLGQMKGTVDQGLATNLGNLWNKYGKNLPPKEGEELGQYIQENVLRKFDQQGNASGKIVHEIQSDLGAQSAKLMRSRNLNRRQLGFAVKDLQGHVKDMLKRNNTPELNKNLQDATNSFRQLVRVDKAAGLLGAHDGVFTPAQLRSAVRATDTTRNKSAFTRGRAEMQDLAEAGQKVLPSKVPDSGTPGRIMTAAALAGGAYTGHAALAVGAGGLAHALYSKPGQYLMEKALMPKESAVKNYLAGMIRNRFGAATNAIAAPTQSVGQLVSPTPQQ